MLVVGSGAGGAPTAAILAEAGFDVLVLEEGPLVRQGEVTPFSLEQMDRQYRAGGVTVALGRPAIAYTEGCCAGGGTEINSGLYRRPPEEVVDRWRTRYRVADLDPVDLYSICDEVERELSVQTVPGAHTPASEALRRGAAALGWRHDEIPRWMDYTSGPDARARPPAQHDRDVPPSGRVRRRPPPHRAIVSTVSCSTATGRPEPRSRRPTAGRPPSTSPMSSCAAGRSRRRRCSSVRGSAHRVGRTLAVHPTVKLAARFDDAVNVPDDVPVHQVKEFAPDLSFGGSASGPGLVALALSDSWPRFRDAVADWRNLAVYYAAITSEGRGRVQALPGCATRWSRIA